MPARASEWHRRSDRVRIRNAGGYALVRSSEMLAALRIV